jgi:hypothetical protein
MDNNLPLQWLRARLQHELAVSGQTMSRLAADLSQGLERVQGNLRFVEELVGGFIEVSEEAQGELARQLALLEQRVNRLEAVGTG